MATSARAEVGRSSISTVSTTFSFTLSRKPSSVSLAERDAAVCSTTNSHRKTSFLERVFNHPLSSKQSLDSLVDSNCNSLKAKYGKTRALLGKGSSASCYVVKRPTDDKTFAVKEFRKRKDGESEKEYQKKLTAEYCIGTLLHHENIIETIDIIFEKEKAYEVMELCTGGDLFEAIQENTMSIAEINCCFAQLLHGVDYLHKMGICHRDLKPENCLFDSNNHLKIIDFGSADVVKSPFDKVCRKSYGRCGSGPYMPPEELSDATYDGTKADIWACGVIYLAMVFQRFPWQTASPTDANFKAYVSAKCQCKFFDRLADGPKNIIKSMLDPNPDLRPTIAEILENPWIRSLVVCEACGGRDASVMHHHGKHGVNKTMTFLSQPTPVIPNDSAQKLLRTCNNCYISKLSCDRGLPICAACQRRKRTDCRYPEIAPSKIAASTRLRRGTRNEYIQTLENQLRRSEEQLRELLQGYELRLQQPYAAFGSSRQSVQPVDSPWSQPHTKTEPAPSYKPVYDAPAPPYVPTRPPPPGSHFFFDPAEFVSPGRGPRHFYPDMNLPFDAIEGLVEDFFCGQTTIVRSIHRQTFLESFYAGYVSLAILNAMAAISARMSKHPAVWGMCPDPYQKGVRAASHVVGDPFYKRARDMVFSTMDRPSFHVYIALMLIAEYSASRESTPYVASQAVLCANRIGHSMALSLDIDPDYLTHMNYSGPLPVTYVAKDMRRRLWWANYLYEINLTLFGQADPSNEISTILAPPSPLPVKTSSASSTESNSSSSSSHRNSPLGSNSESLLPSLPGPEADFQRSFWSDLYPPPTINGHVLPPFSSLGLDNGRRSFSRPTGPPPYDAHGAIGYQPHPSSVGNVNTPYDNSIVNTPYNNNNGRNHPINYNHHMGGMPPPAPNYSYPNSTMSPQASPRPPSLPLSPRSHSTPSLHAYRGLPPHPSATGPPPSTKQLNNDQTRSWPDGYLNLLQLYKLIHHGLDINVEKQRLNRKFPTSKVVNGEEATERAMLAIQLDERTDKLISSIRSWLNSVPESVYELTSDPSQITSDCGSTVKPSFMYLHSIMLGHSILMWLYLRSEQQLQTSYMKASRLSPQHQSYQPVSNIIQLTSPQGTSPPPNTSSSGHYSAPPSQCVPDPRHAPPPRPVSEFLDQKQQNEQQYKERQQQKPNFQPTAPPYMAPQSPPKVKNERGVSAAVAASLESAWKVSCILEALMMRDMYLNVSLGPVAIWTSTLAAHTFWRCLNVEPAQCREGMRRAMKATRFLSSKWALGEKAYQVMLSLTSKSPGFTREELESF
ncbi:hypothetical protein SmJEL517_g02120 [Synchytrium microbalum]|uniref:Zn(2)-C6 fungal-type domain-containing protein n=1 Tax=Synchytrium microbalum TaxID=1806994 RepID=A0A507CBW3_9FUNG|nr:uncharacterized protein SmJEL517_g02120 [Synchytrium microbalum]TPX35434.1 hypothetical protein SmJEL517_g02120 [Synchytrium microbalum]